MNAGHPTSSALDPDVSLNHCHCEREDIHVQSLQAGYIQISNEGVSDATDDDLEKEWDLYNVLAKMFEESRGNFLFQHL